MTLANDLRDSKLIPSPCRNQRPFTCDGLPQSCTVMVVGKNSRTEMDTDWWTWWNHDTGFDLRRFEDEYMATTQGDWSRTRKRLNQLRCCYHLPCLETNAFMHEGPDARGKKKPNTPLLRLFLDKIPLKAVIAHGKDAQEKIEAVGLPPSVHYFPTPHFRSISNVCFKQTAAEVAALVIGTDAPAKKDDEQIPRGALRAWAACQREVIAVYVFGSRARGTARADSDLDLAFELDETRGTTSDLTVLVVNRESWRQKLTKMTRLVVRDLHLRSDEAVSGEVVEVYRRLAVGR
jgi:hypothetical protein